GRADRRGERSGVDRAPAAGDEPGGCLPAPGGPRGGVRRGGGGSARMRGTFVIAQKEVREIFSSPIAYVALAMFFLIEGYLFFSLVGVYSLQVLQLQRTPPTEFTPTRLIFTPLYHATTFLPPPPD